ncbi:MAG: UDP-2,4-diacetamido-2,4,6-trideoxy-beta-L-altropyranose hydrolase, partial [Desulfovibrionaceae bacterium]|nr:UDP-2,4-diacetamido-2,4,6-trideoxy-beta-L-altropyranose hydrolase [Desulfovibrionaceae bacterium]
MNGRCSLLIRADAAPRMGTGHVMRGLALAQAAQAGGMDVHLICRAGVAWLLSRLERESIPLHLLSDMAPSTEQPGALLRQIQAPGLPVPHTSSAPIWVVLDGYHFDTDCQIAVMNAGYHLLVIDDYAHLPAYHCNLLLNQNIGAEELVYRGAIGRKLLGPEYALLRQEFLNARERAVRRVAPAQPQKILVTLGGGDFIEYLEKIAESLLLPELKGRVIRVIQGGMDPERIRAAFAGCPATLEILPRVEDMPGLLLDTDLCITAGGSTCWELCCLGIPFLTVEVAENQHHICAWLKKRGYAPYFSRAAMIRALTTQPKYITASGQTSVGST